MICEGMLAQASDLKLKLSSHEWKQSEDESELDVGYVVMGDLSSFDAV